MGALKIEILNPKALQLIEGLQDLNLIKISKGSSSKIDAYLKKMRQKAATAPTEDEIASIVEEVRAERYGKK